MEADKLIGLIIGGSAVVGGLAIGAIAIIISVPWAMKEKLAKIEAKSRERLMMLEKGIDPSIALRESRGVGQDPMLWGLLLAGMGLGIFLGYLLHLVMDWDAKILTNALGILFAGLGLVVYHPIRKRSQESPNV